MQAFLRQHMRSVIAIALVAFFLVPADLVAQSHVVTPADLQKEVVAASQARQRNLEAVQQFLSTPAAEKAMKSAQVDPQQVRTAVSTLSDQELAQLAVRADKAQADFAAGNITDHDLLIILVAVLALILIIVAVR